MTNKFKKVEIMTPNDFFIQEDHLESIHNTKNNLKKGYKNGDWVILNRHSNKSQWSLFYAPLNCYHPKYFNSLKSAKQFLEGIYHRANQHKIDINTFLTTLNKLNSSASLIEARNLIFNIFQF